MTILIIGYPFEGRGGVETIVPKVAHHLQKNKSLHGFVFFQRKILPTVRWNWLADFRLIKFNSKLPRFLSVIYFALKVKGYLKQNPSIDTLICLNPQICQIARLAVGTKSKYQIISWIHGSLHDLSYKNIKRILCADRHWAISAAIATQLEDNGVNKNNIDLIYNGIERQPQSLTGETSKLTLLNVGRLQLDDKKSLRTLFDALATLKIDWVLHIIGGNPDKNQENKCIEYVRSLNLTKNVHFHGWQNKPWDYVLEHIGPVSVLVGCSTSEGFPMTLIEAMSWGIPCIWTDCPTGPSEIIQHEKNGYLFPISDAKALAQTLEKFANSQVILTEQEIKESINCFYEQEYFKRIDQALNH